MTYAGLIIDGPMDGKRIETQKPIFEAEVRQPVTLSPAKTVEQMAATAADVTTVRYKHHRTKTGGGLWLLEDETVEQAVQHMLNRVGIDALASRYEQITLRQQDDAPRVRTRRRGKDL